MDKLECYNRLFRIRDNNNINIDEQIKQIAGKSVVPTSVISFINKYLPSDSYKTFENIYNKRHKNPLYKNLVNENSTLEDKAIALSSLVTQTLIGSKSINESYRKDYLDDMMTKEVLNALLDYSNGSTNKLESVFNKLRNQIKSNFRKDLKEEGVR